MTRWFPAYTPHGAKVHATPTPPDNRVPAEIDHRMTRVALCGRQVYAGGPPARFSIAWGDPCARCQASIDKTPPENAP